MKMSRAARRRTPTLARGPEGSQPDWDAHCVDHVAAHYRKVTGKSLWRVLHHRAPRSAKEAAALYRKNGVTSFRAAVTKVLGKPISPAFAMRGDIALIRPTGGGDLIPALGIVRGDLIECMDNMLPIDRAEIVWKLSKFRAS